MKGKILDYSIAESYGVILGNDGVRYKFSGKDWKSESYPEIDLLVDFEANGSVAVSIYQDGNVQSAARASSQKRGTNWRFVLIGLLIMFLGVAFQMWSAVSSDKERQANLAAVEQSNKVIVAKSDAKVEETKVTADVPTTTVEGCTKNPIEIFEIGEPYFFSVLSKTLDEYCPGARYVSKQAIVVNWNAQSFTITLSKVSHSKDGEMFEITSIKAL